MERKKVHSHSPISNKLPPFRFTLVHLFSISPSNSRPPRRGAQGKRARLGPRRIQKLVPVQLVSWMVFPWLSTMTPWA